MGHKPTHLDSHHHVHLLNSNIDVALKLAQEYDLPIRQETYLQKILNLFILKNFSITKMLHLK